MENKQDALVTSEGWRALQNIGIEEGIVGIGYEETGDNSLRWNNRVYQHLKHHLWWASSASVTCPSAMTDGAASLLGRHLNDTDGGVFSEARRRLISRDTAIAWTSGQWMTERKGGSDVRGTETLARKLQGNEKEESDGVDAIGVPLGPWRIDGFKWFSSATDANMTILLAKTGKEGNVSVFYAPMRRRVKDGAEGETELNGVRIQRLKNKLGTKPLPTAELEINGMRGYLIGKEGEGVKEISTILNITRVHNSVSAVAGWGRGLAISRAFARVRMAGGKLLADIPAHMRSLAQEHVRYRAHVHLIYFVVALLGISEGQDSGGNHASGASILPRDTQLAQILLRTLTPLMKAQTALGSTNGLRACMENLGGVGYLENEDPSLNIARIFRDSCVLSIWEGTTDIMADDLVRVVKGREGAKALSALDDWISNGVSIAEKHSFQSEASKLREMWVKWLKNSKGKDKDQLKWEGRTYLQGLETVICGFLLMMDAARDQDPVARTVAKRWIREDESSIEPWKSEAGWDRRIVFGDDAGKSRL
jgi:alkylation response protein AidB-like acyl-CoA dehydrogenase